MYLLDSDFVINLLKKDTEAQIILAQLVQKTDTPFSISVISLAEIKEGLLAIQSQKRLTQFQTLLEAMYVVPFRAKTAVTFAEIRLHLRKKGQLLDNMDLLIAATCIEHDLTLVTFNTKHFTRIPKLKIHETISSQH
jgi:predicted nucleic acid-binding protein